MTDMQISVRLGRETGLNVGVNALFQVLIYKIMYKIGGCCIFSRFNFF